MDDLLGLVFNDADEAHRQHLVTEKLSDHEALGEFYVAIREHLDTFVEAAIGLDVELPSEPEKPILDTLEESYVELRGMRADLCQGDTTLENLFDNLTAQYARTLFKLKRLIA